MLPGCGVVVMVCALWSVGHRILDHFSCCWWRRAHHIKTLTFPPQLNIFWFLTFFLFSHLSLFSNFLSVFLLFFYFVLFSVFWLQVLCNYTFLQHIYVLHIIRGVPSRWILWYSVNSVCFAKEELLNVIKSLGSTRFKEIDNIQLYSR